MFATRLLAEVALHMGMFGVANLLGLLAGILLGWSSGLSIRAL